MTTLHTLYQWSKNLKEGSKMPVLFIGHGSPMNGIEDNDFSRQWAQLGKEIPLPKAVLVVSAHWLTAGTHITAMERPRTIHDFGGFPQELFDVQYPASGNPELATEVSQLITTTEVHLNHDWGLDHGAWTVVRHMYPEANIPVLQLSIDYFKPPQYHYNLAKQLQILRKKGVLILGSGNMIHNLRMLDWKHINTPNFGFDWAIELNEVLKKNIAEYNHQQLIDYQTIGKGIEMAVPTPEHYYPLLYALGLQEKTEDITFFNDRLVGGSLNMTSVILG